MQHMIAMVRQRWIPSLFVFGFLVVVGVNATLIVTAVNSFSGLVVAHPYRKGVEYSQTHQALAAQQALGWQYRIETAAAADGGMRLAVRWTGTDGMALPGLRVVAELSRPVENLPPMQVELGERGAGRYETLLQLPLAGLWDLRLTAQRGDRRFVAAERLRVP